VLSEKTDVGSPLGYLFTQTVPGVAVIMSVECLEAVRSL
jgi:hypothetical protein